MTTTTQGEHAQTEALRLADEYAAAHAKWALEDLYGSSRSYTAEKLAERHDARAKLERALHAQVAALTAAPGAQSNTKTHALLSTMIGLFLRAKEKIGYQPGSAIDKTVAEAVEHLKDWPYPETAATAQPAAPQGVAYAELPYKQVLWSKNCMQCCVAYMMGLPLESVPDFAADGGWQLFSDFVESRGYAAVMLPGNHEFEADYLASGTTARGTSHMVVMNDGKLVHDPHPSNSGLLEVQCVWLLAKRASPTSGQQDEHAAFEASAKAYTSKVSFARDEADYVDMTASLLWHGWKLRAHHGQAPAGASKFADVIAVQRSEAESDPSDAYMVGLYNGMSMMDANYRNITDWEPMGTVPKPTPTAQAASSAVLKAIREANMQLVRTGDDAFMLVPYKAVTAQAAASVPAVDEFQPCPSCFGKGVDGDTDDYGRTIDVTCGECEGSGRAKVKGATEPKNAPSRYRDKCTLGGRCLGGCLVTEPCYHAARAPAESVGLDAPAAGAVAGPVAAGMVPVAEVVECGTMGQQTLREIDGRWRWLSIGERLYAQADTGFIATPTPAAQADSAPSPVGGYGLVDGAAICEAAAKKWEREAKRHKRAPGSLPSQHEARDLERARLCRNLAEKIRSTKPAHVADSVLEDAASAGFFLQLPQRPKPEAPAGTVGLDWDAYSGAQMLAFGRDCSNAAIVATQKPGGA